LLDRIRRFKAEKALADDYEEFSEKALVEHFKGEQRAIKRYVLDSVRDSITHSSENKLRDFVEYAGKGSEKPISYSTIEKTFYSKFIYQETLGTPWNYRAEIGENPRELEKSQIIRLMSLIAEKLYIGKYDEEIGTRRLENKIQGGVDVPETHLRAYRMAKEEILHCWIGYVGQIIEHYFIQTGRPIDKEKLFQYPFPEQLWTNIGNFIENLGRLAIWKNREASQTLFGGKQTYSFWQHIFETGSSPSNTKVMPSGLNIMEMIKA
jgi:hypothetical protein